jgi:hypothetical protein
MNNKYKRGIKTTLQLVIKIVRTSRALKGEIILMLLNITSAFNKVLH